MIEPVLISGPPSSGKTTRMNEILDNYAQMDILRINFQAFKVRSKINLKEFFKVVAIEEVTTLTDIVYCADVFKKYGLPMIITTQEDTKYFSEEFLSAFELIILP